MASTTNSYMKPVGVKMKKYSVRLKSLADIRRFLARVANDLDKDEIEAGKARTLTYIGSILSQVIRDSDLEARISALEENQRRENQ